jgi:hypothetical protein
MLLLPGHTRLEMPGATASAGSSTGDATVTSHAVSPAGSGSSGSGPTRGLTVSGGGSPSAFGGGQAGSRSAGGRDALSAGPLRPAVPPRSLRLPAVSSLLSPAGTIGDPGVRCLHGYVWRRAYQGDYVCVTPGTRAQAVIDNAAASSRMASGGYTCQPGYVWRQVAPADYICVTPGSRAQAAADNAQANNRVALLSLWLSDWTPPARLAQQDCSETDCSAAGVGWGGANFQINGDHFNVGPVLLQIRRNDGTVLWSSTVAATVYPGFAGGALYAQTPAGDCSNVPGTSKNDYAIAYDTVSGRWSNEVPLDSGCASS